MSQLFKFIFILMYLHSAWSKQHTNVVIVGGTGDLARKYLWQSSLNLFTNYFNQENTFSFYAAGRLRQEDGSQTLNKILENVQCDTWNSRCVNLRPTFLKSTSYFQLKFPENYTELCQSFSKRKEDQTGVKIRQIFYLSIPSSAYETVAAHINENCRHSNISTTQVVLEKPFGSDKQSASQQINVIGKYFSDDETYRTDHYLAKSVSKQILHFRDINREKLDDLMRTQKVDRVEVVMKETIGVKGRIEFYDQNGVIRDVMQNHLTELLALIAMDLPHNVSNSKQVMENKLRLLRRVKQVGRNSLLTGQYSGYITEAIEELKNISRSQFTPTFAAALLQVDNARWRGVPFLLISGKQLEERSSYVRVLFREQVFCVGDCSSGNSSLLKYPRQLIFQIGYGSVPSPGVLVSKSLFTPKWPKGLNELPITSKDSFIHGQSPGDFSYAVPVSDVQAYDTVLNDVYTFARETFVNSKRLVLLWDVWDRVLYETKNTLPRLYKENSANNLNFKVENFQLKFLIEDGNTVIHGSDDAMMASIPKLYRNCTLVCTDNDALIENLSEKIISIAENSIHERNVFHLAVSGGSSPLKLFDKLVTDFPHFPWDQTHIWQVDERCVSHESSDSNFLTLYDRLLKFVHIPFFNIHPMPVNFAGRLCNSDDNGDKRYAENVKYLIKSEKFDMILLGLGSDGHTASIFPETPAVHMTGTVRYTQTKIGGRQDRMSLMFPLINKAREIAVLVMGTSKHDVVHKIQNVREPSDHFPITHVSPEGNTTWYIDLEAWTGHTNH